MFCFAITRKRMNRFITRPDSDVSAGKSSSDSSVAQCSP
jgi:hypothetical protein